MRLNLKAGCIAILVSIFIFGLTSYAQDYQIGVFYFPGWANLDLPWKYGWEYIKSSPEREPLLGWYPEEEIWVAEKHIEWAAKYGISFFAYDWYWRDKKPFLDHAINNFMKAKNNHLMKFCIMWANHGDTPKDFSEFKNIAKYWTDNYFNHPRYLKIGNAPVVFIFSPSNLERQLGKDKEAISFLKEYATSKGFNGVFIVAITNSIPTNPLAEFLKNKGYQAFTGWNYVHGLGRKRVASYDSMVEAYKFMLIKAKDVTALPYIPSASPGWDDRPWKGKDAVVRTDPTPEKFKDMLLAAKEYLDKEDEPKIIMIEAWNEFGEGSYIEPTKKWGVKYLETIKEVLGGK